MLPVEQPFKTYTGKDGKPLDNGYVYFGLPDENPVTSPIAVFWDAAGTIPATQPIRTNNGYISRAGTPANVFIDAAYSELVLDSKKRQVFFARNSEEFSIATAVSKFLSNIAQGAGSKTIGFLQSMSGAVLRTIFGKLTETKSFEDFGAVGDGVADDYIAIQKAFDWAGGVPGSKLVGTSGARYRTSKGWTMKFDGKFQDPTSAVCIDFSGTQIIPSSGDMVCVKAARDFVTIINPVVVNQNGFPNIVAYGVLPEDPAQKTSQVSQQFCRIINPVAYGVDVAIKQMPGPTVSGAASGSFYNTYENLVARDVKCAIWLAGNPNALDVLNTRTTIKNPMHVGGNCTLWGEALDTTNVEGGSAENITTGTWPFATPTTIKIPVKYPGHQLDNNTVRFNGFVAETGRIPYDIAAFYCPMENCEFIGYTQPAVGDQSRTQWSNKGTVMSETTRANTLALFSAKITGGSAAGKQAYLGLDGSGNYPAELYSDTGFKSVSRCDIGDLRSTRVGGQLLGGDNVSVAVGGSTQKTLIYNLSSTIFEFGGITSIRPDTDNLCALGGPANRASTVYAGTGAINTSDERSKENIGPIDAAAMRAVARINFVQFKFKDSLERKGDGARWHYGVLAQQVKEAFEAEDLNPFDYGLLCYDEWTDQFEPVVAEREVEILTADGEPRVITEKYHTGEMELVRPAGNRYGVRYDELYSLVLAYLMSKQQD